LKSRYGSNPVTQPVKLDRPHWYAVHTKPRQEHIAEEHLRRQGFECLLPRAWNPSQRLPSQKPRVEPLFPRYLFIQAVIGHHNISAVNYTRGVSRLVKFGHELGEVPEWVVKWIRQGIDAVSGLVQLGCPTFSPGDAVEVFDGPFSGFRGIFEATDGEQRALLMLDLLGRANRISVSTSCLRAAR
jgi:transcriptional antiterminator RfaH